MKVLSIDTSSNLCSVSILENTNLIKKIELNNGLTHSETLMPLIKQILDENNISLKDINLPEGLERIYENAFEGCVSIESMIIPSTVTEIGRSAFEGCTNLKYFIVLNPKLDIRNIGLPEGCKIICPGKEVETI